MSDRDTSTCGGCCKTCANGDLLTTVHCKVHCVTFDADGRCYCGGEDYVGNDYKRLADVAVDLYKCLWSRLFHSDMAMDPALRTRFTDNQMLEFKEQLEALGVNVDGDEDKS